MPHWRTQGGGSCRAAPLPPKVKFDKHGFFRHGDTKVLCDLRFSLNKPLKSAEDYYSTGILKNVIKTYENLDFFCSVSFNFPCNLTGCRLGDFHMIFITLTLKSNVDSIYPQSQPPKKNSGYIHGMPAL